MNYFTSVLKKYAVFSGRARRAEYWYFVLFSVIISFVLDLTRLKVLSVIFSLGTLVPSIAVCVRRLHDTNRSGWWTLLALIPILGWIPLIIFLATDGTPGDNKYGQNPKGDLVVVPTPTPTPTQTPTQTS